MTRTLHSTQVSDAAQDDHQRSAMNHEAIRSANNLAAAFVANRNTPPVPEASCKKRRTLLQTTVTNEARRMVGHLTTAPTEQRSSTPVPEPSSEQRKAPLHQTLAEEKSVPLASDLDEESTPIDGIPLPRREKAPPYPQEPEWAHKLFRFRDPHLFAEWKGDLRYVSLCKERGDPSPEWPVVIRHPDGLIGNLIPGGGTWSVVPSTVPIYAHWASHPVMGYLWRLTVELRYSKPSSHVVTQIHNLKALEQRAFQEDELDAAVRHQWTRYELEDEPAFPLVAAGMAELLRLQERSVVPNRQRQPALQDARGQALLNGRHVQNEKLIIENSRVLDHVQVAPNNTGVDGHIDTYLMHRYAGPVPQMTLVQRREYEHPDRLRAFQRQDWRENASPMPEPSQTLPNLNVGVAQAPVSQMAAQRPARTINPAILMPHAPKAVPKMTNLADHTAAHVAINDIDPGIGFSDGLDELMGDFDAVGTFDPTFPDTDNGELPTYMPTFEEINNSIPALQRPQQHMLPHEHPLGPMVNQDLQRNDLDDLA